MPSPLIRCDNCDVETYYYTSGECHDGVRRKLCNDAQKCYANKHNKKRLLENKQKQDHVERTMNQTIARMKK